MKLQPIIERLRELAKDPGVHGSLAASMLSRLPESLNEEAEDPVTQVVAASFSLSAYRFEEPSGTQLSRAVAYLETHPGPRTTAEIAAGTGATESSLRNILRLSEQFVCVERRLGRGGWKKWVLRMAASA